MPASIRSAALKGIAASPVTVEVDVLAGLPSFTVVGLTDKAIQESRERITAALTNIGFKPPRRKTIVSLAPASLKKEGSLYDVAIALGFLIASEQLLVEPARLDRAWLIGELGLDGTIRGVRGTLPMALAAAKQGIEQLYLPSANAREVNAVADTIAIYPVASLPDLITQLTGTAQQRVAPAVRQPNTTTVTEPEIDFADIRGQEHAKRALLIAAASSHNVLLVGAPGSGKTLLARALAGILPPLTREESYAVTSLYSIAGLLPADLGLMTTRPFRSPHHGASAVALVGGGTNPKPGEVSLAHTGVLFLDELPEFSRQVLDQLRQPIEDGVIMVSRASSTVQFPARSILVGAMNPCKCGWLGSEQKSCQCPPGDIFRYQRRVSGPLLDRFDIHVLINDIPIEQLLSRESSAVPSAELAGQAVAARHRQIRRQGKVNAELSVKEIEQYCVIEARVEKLLHQAEQRFHITSRGVHRLLKVSRTIADLADQQQIQATHVAEALQYREQLQQALPDFI